MERSESEKRDLIEKELLKIREMLPEFAEVHHKIIPTENKRIGDHVIIANFPLCVHFQLAEDDLKLGDEEFSDLVRNKVSRVKISLMELLRETADELEDKLVGAHMGFDSS